VSAVSTRHHHLASASVEEDRHELRRPTETAPPFPASPPFRCGSPGERAAHSPYHRATNEELRVLRAKLGEQLSEMKQMLAKPGRGGQWSSFLEERQIPRATADRLVARHLRSLDPDANRLSEPVSEPTEEEVQRLFIAVWPKLGAL
jgi:hypothetical protein